MAPRRGIIGVAHVVAALFALTGCAPNHVSAPVPTSTESAITGPGYRVVRTLPHDPDAFTEGLVIADGALFESTGQRGSGSSIRRIDLATGRVTKLVKLRRDLFAEGLAVHGGRLYQLTWQDHLVLTYDEELNQVAEERFGGEAWGLSSDTSHLILSDGTNALSIVDPTTLAVAATVHVFDGDHPVAGLNELERLDGEILANVFGSSRIARIDPASGRVRSWLDLSALVNAVGATDEDATLNGIAVDPANGHLFVTGKLWPKIFELELSPRRQQGRS